MNRNTQETIPYLLRIFLVLLFSPCNLALFFGFSSLKSSSSSDFELCLINELDFSMYHALPNSFCKTFGSTALEFIKNDHRRVMHMDGLVLLSIGRKLSSLFVSGTYAG